MKTRYIFLLFVSMNILSCKSQDISVMTYNIRLDVASDGENAWPNRKDMLSDQVLFLEPDVLGVQEAKPNQVVELSEKLENYNNFGLGRDGGQEGEHSSIYYNSETCEVGEKGTFWLSETPSQVSKGWDAAFPRICTYGLFNSKKSNKKFWVFNTHLDHVGAEARLQGMRLIYSKISELNKDHHPVILMGDFNVEPDSDLIQELTKSMNDSKAVSLLDFGSNGTFNGFDTATAVTRRIDYIMVSKSDKVEVKKYAVLSSLIDQRYPSDHFPVLVQFHLR